MTTKSKMLHNFYVSALRISLILVYIQSQSIMWFYSRRWAQVKSSACREKAKKWHAHRSSSLQRSSGFTHRFKLAEKDWNYKKSFACIPSFKDRLINRKLRTYKSRHLWQCRYYPFASLYATWRGVVFFCAERPIVIICCTLRYQKWKKIGGKKKHRTAS